MTSVEHPRWCCLTLCGVTDGSLPLSGGEHRSEPLQLDLRRVLANRGAVKVTAAYLTKAECPWGTETFLHLATNDDDLDLPLSQAAGVLRQLSELVAHADH